MVMSKEFVISSVRNRGSVFTAINCFRNSFDHCVDNVVVAAANGNDESLCDCCNWFSQCKASWAGFMIGTVVASVLLAALLRRPSHSSNRRKSKDGSETFGTFDGTKSVVPT